MSFAENLRTIRKERNISQEQLAEMLSVSRQAVSKWEQGTVYPETEKLILISKVLNISLDYLLLDDNFKKNKDSIISNPVIIPTGKISIRTYDGESIITCHKVSCSRILSTGKKEPKYILNGVDKVTFWGDHNNILGWYAEKKDVHQEIEEITAAINDGVPTYQLKYAAKVKIGVFNAKLLDDTRS